MDHLFNRLAEGLSPAFRLIRPLGSGGAAHVFVADDMRRQQQVALKVLREELAATVSAERFLAEIGVAAKLDHPNIVPLYDSGSVHGLPYYVMPLILGESLHARLARVRRLSVQLALHITREIGAALEYAHGLRVIHRDIKPENVLLAWGGARAMVLDFGIALALDAKVHPRRTKPGLIPGTPEYMSPEQAAGEPQVDGRSDIYSLACVAYEMICGEPPFVGVPRGVCRVLSRALEKLPSDRYATPGAFVAALSEAWSARGKDPRLPLIERLWAWERML